MLLLVFVSDLQTMPRTAFKCKERLFKPSSFLFTSAQEPVMSFLCFVILFGFGFLVNSENVVDN